ncbi:hypothetical protein [Xanthomonas graminis]|uniref:hypothetical protein n=1 Tax=Xanthomonas graminis TaxID=3390026 RepID=UPI00118730C8|nr:hypothetical protein [Xanthomonas translucens]UKE67237.1 hypothetical protein KM547_08505 [Xanthomonas translucens pv. phlei]
MIDLKRSGYRVRRETLIGEAKSRWVRLSPESKAQAQNPIVPKHPGHSVFSSGHRGNWWPGRLSQASCPPQRPGDA